MKRQAFHRRKLYRKAANMEMMISAPREALNRRRVPQRVQRDGKSERAHQRVSQRVHLRAMQAKLERGLGLFMLVNCHHRLMKSRRMLLP